MNEDAIEFHGPGGMRRGIVTLPDAGPSGGTTGVLLLPAGLKYRVGPHRLNVALARALAPMGYSVLRFDPFGIGDSDGQLPGGPLRELWLGVEQGRFVEDTLKAARELRERYGLRRIVAGGLCGGAVTALLAAAVGPDLIDGVLSINTAVTFSMDAKAARRPIGRLQARHNFKAYLQKLFSPAAWARMARGDSDYAGITHTVVATVRSCVRGSAPVAPASHTNAQFIESFDALERRRTPHLLVFSGNDNRWLEFQELVFQHHLGGRSTGAGYEIQVIPDANHELHLSVWQRQLQERFGEWLGRHFCEAERPARMASV